MANSGGIWFEKSADEPGTLQENVWHAAAGSTSEIFVILIAFDECDSTLAKEAYSMCGFYIN